MKRGKKTRNPKKQLFSESLHLLKAKKRLVSDSTVLEHDSDKYVLQAEKDRRMTLIKKSNSLRKSANEKSRNLKALKKNSRFNDEICIV